MIYGLVALVLVFSIVNLVRMTAFSVASNAYDMKKAKRDNKYKHYLLKNYRLKYAGNLVARLLMFAM
jgi:hypothetical protein